MRLCPRLMPALLPALACAPCFGAVDAAEPVKTTVGSFGSAGTDGGGRVPHRAAEDAGNQKAPPKEDALSDEKRIAAETFKNTDADRDGFICPKEWRGSLAGRMFQGVAKLSEPQQAEVEKAGKPAFEAADTDKDGRISKAEWEAAQEPKEHTAEKLAAGKFKPMGGNAGGAPAGRDQKPFTPTTDYRKENMLGFCVMINPEVFRHEAEAPKIRAELLRQLTEIRRVVPDGPLADMKKVRIWIEWDQNPGGAAEFHTSAAWLKEHGINPEKVGNVDLSNAGHFLDWSQKNQPWMVLHELAHARHLVVLGDGHAGVQAAYDHAVAARLYERVKYSDGTEKKAYALGNAKEYYAELSEAYFGKNDFFPFNREELKAFDSVGHRLMVDTWGLPKPANAAAKDAQATP